MRPGAGRAPAGLEGDLSCHLHDAVVAGRGDNSKRTRSCCGYARRSKVGVIEYVEGLAAKLEVHAFANLEIPEQAQIDAGEAWSADHSTLLGAYLAKSPGVETGRQWRRESAAVEPLLTRADLGSVTGSWVADLVGAEACGSVACDANSGGIIGFVAICLVVEGVGVTIEDGATQTLRDGQWQARVHGEDAGGFPTANEVSDQSALVLHPGQLIDAVHG